jgi:hypothetical protein
MGLEDYHTEKVPVMAGFPDCEFREEVYYFGVACHHPEIYLNNDKYPLRQKCKNIFNSGCCPLGGNS